MSIPNGIPTDPKHVQLTIFPPLPQSSCGGSSCSCHPSTNSTSQTGDSWESFSSKLHQAQERGQVPFRIDIAEYTSIVGVRSTLQRLNEVFSASGVSYEVTADELGGILLAYAPIIAINDRIMATRVFPVVAQLIEMMKTIAAPVPTETPIG